MAIEKYRSIPSSLSPGHGIARLLRSSAVLSSPSLHPLPSPASPLPAPAPPPSPSPASALRPLQRRGSAAPVPPDGPRRAANPREAPRAPTWHGTAGPADGTAAGATQRRGCPPGAAGFRRGTIATSHPRYRPPPSSLQLTLVNPAAVVTPDPCFRRGLPFPPDSQCTVPCFVRFKNFHIQDASRVSLYIECRWRRPTLGLHLPGLFARLALFSAIRIGLQRYAYRGHAKEKEEGECFKFIAISDA